MGSDMNWFSTTEPTITFNRCIFHSGIKLNLPNTVGRVVFNDCVFSQSPTEEGFVQHYIKIKYPDNNTTDINLDIDITGTFEMKRIYTNACEYDDDTAVADLKYIETLYWQVWNATESDQDGNINITINDTSS